jgi:hypothetical protein
MDGYPGRMILPLALALLPLLGQPQIVQLSAEQLDQRLAELQQRPAVGDRIDALSRLFLETPYVEHPLGEGGDGPEPQTRFRLDGVDCQTFVETVLALTNARSVAHARRVLDDIRYFKEPISFATRSHFTEAQWLPSLVGKGYLRDEVPAFDRHAATAELVLERARWSQLPFLQRLLPAEVPEGRFPVRFLTSAQLKKEAGQVANGTVVLVVRAHDPERILRVSHMGFLVRGPAGTLVRHASSTAHRVVEEPIVDYVGRMDGLKKWPVAGYALYLPLDAKARAEQVLPKAAAAASE